MTMEELRFSGAIRGVFEQITGAALPGNDANSFLRGIRNEYVDAGSPNPVKKWIETALSKLILTATDMPSWRESNIQTWPFQDGRPTTYLGVLTVPDNQITKQYAAPSVQLLLFGIRVQMEDGWTMKYTVVEQHPDL